MLPGPATTDVVGRLSALSPGDRVTSSLPCRALCRQRSAGADVSANIRAGQMVVRSIYTPRGERNLSSARPDFLRLSVAVTPLPRYRPAPVQLALRQSPLAGASPRSPFATPRSPAPVQLGAGTATPVAPAPDAPRLPAVSTPLTTARFTAVRTCRASPWSGLVVVRRGQDLSWFAVVRTCRGSPRCPAGRGTPPWPCARPRRRAGPAALRAPCAPRRCPADP